MVLRQMNAWKSINLFVIQHTGIKSKYGGSGEVEKIILKRLF